MATREILPVRNSPLKELAGPDPAPLEPFCEVCTESVALVDEVVEVPMEPAFTSHAPVSLGSKELDASETKSEVVKRVSIVESPVQAVLSLISADLPTPELSRDYTAEERLEGGAVRRIFTLDSSTALQEWGIAPENLDLTGSSDGLIESILAEGHFGLAADVMAVRRRLRCDTGPNGRPATVSERVA